MSQSAGDELKKLIQKKLAERDKLKKRIAGLDSEIYKLNESYKVITGIDLLKKPGGNTPVLDYVEDMLKEHEKLHVDEMVARLRSEHKIEAPKQSIASGLIRFHNQGKRFERVARNTFALRKKEEEK